MYSGRWHLVKAANAVSGRRVTIVIACIIMLVLIALASLFLAGRFNMPTTRAGGAASVSAIPSNRNAYVPGQLIVGLDDAGSEGGALLDAVDEALEAVGFKAESMLVQASEGEGSIVLVSTGESYRVGDELEQAEREIARISGVSYVQPNYRYASQAVKATDVAKDKNVSEQWYLNDWSEYGANVAEAWGMVDSQTKVDVAVFDTGMYVMQELDSSNNAIVRPENFHQEFDASNLDIEHALDFVHSTDNSNPQPLVNDKNPYGDDNGHGTHVSGIIAAQASTTQTPGNAARGMAGVSQNARIIPMKVLDAGGEGDTADFISAYSYLIDRAGAGKEFPNLHVINLSLALTLDDGEDDDYDDAEDDESGSSVTADEEGEVEVIEQAPLTENAALRAMIDKAHDKGVVTVCAAGNEGSSAETYPSDYPECVSVTALNKSGEHTAFSNKNERKDISAPGTDIYSSWGSQADAYATFSGTSQAAAITSGVFSMLWAVNPSLTVGAAKNAVYNTAHKVTAYEASPQLQASAVASGSNGLVALNVQGLVNGSHGAIDAAAAVAYAKDPSHDAEAEDEDVKREGSAKDAPDLTTPTDPTNPTQPTNPSNPTQPAQPADPTDPAQQADPTDPTDPAQPADPTDPAQPADPTQPTDPDNPGDPTDPGITPTKSLAGATLLFLGDPALDGTANEGSYLYAGKALEPKPEVLDVDFEKVSEIDPVTGLKNWVIGYANNDRPGTATATIKGVNAYEGSATEEFTIVGGSSDIVGGSIEATPLVKEDVKLTSTSLTYTGKALEPAVTVKKGSRTLVLNSDYVVKYANNKNPGKATVTVTGIRSYKGSIELGFKIALGKPKLSKLAAGSGSLTAKWKRMKSGGVGYQVRYSLKKNMKAAKTKSIKKNATVKAKVKKLKHAKRYYVQVRTYKKIGSKTYYSSWSGKKTIKVR